MVQTVDLLLDVTNEAGLGEPASVAVTVHLPDSDPRESPQTVCFAKPGGGYSRRYFTEDLPGPARGAQAQWHAERGWVFVSVDYLGAGDSSTNHDPNSLTFTSVAAASQAAEQETLRRLAAGELSAAFPALDDPLVLGIGQSLGGCMAIIQQGRYRSYHGIGVLGFGAIHDHPPARPGDPPFPAPWIPRDGLAGSEPVVLNSQQPNSLDGMVDGAGMAMAWGFFFDDVDPEIVRRDLDGFPDRRDMPRWGSATVPGAVGAMCLTPGAVAPEAAAVLVPVLVAMGERDVIADPKGEPRAYLSAKSVDLFVCPRMGHMHNFAGTRELFWRRIETWAEWVRSSRTQTAASSKSTLSRAI